MNEGRRYKILGAVGRGGFGTVYRAELTGDGGFSKVVALKVLNPDMEEVNEMAVRLRDEARVLGLLRHRAVVQVDGLVRLSGRWTVVMEYVEGADLKQVLSAAGPFPATAALTILEEVAGALHVAYTRAGPDGRPLQLLHRDIKPSNIQVTAAGETKLLDFGVARAEFAGREAETRSLMFGSVGYMSPERLDFVDGPAGDVYALGAVLYELLGGVAFGKTSSNEGRHEARLAKALDGLRAVDVPEPLVALVAEMMAYEPSARPTVREIERRAARLRTELDGPAFRDWAEDHVTPVLRDRRDLPDELSGATLVEQASESMAPARAPPPPPDRPAPAAGDSGARTVTTARTVAAVGSLGLLGLGGFAVVAAIVAVILLRDGTGEAVTVAPTAAPPAVDVPPAPEPTAVPVAPEPTAVPVAPEPTAVPVAAEPPSVPVAAATSSPAVAPPVKARPVAAVTAPDAATSPSSRSSPSSPSASPTTHVSATGDARAVELVAGGRRLGLGDVPPGDYAVEAAFGDGAFVPAGRVQLVAGGVTTLHCEAVFSRCRVK